MGSRFVNDSSADWAGSKEVRNDWIRGVLHAREVLAGNADRMPSKVGAIRPIVYESWCRSKLQGLDPCRVAPGHHPDLELDSPLTRIAEPITERRQGAVVDAGFVLTLTDNEGRLLRRWAPEGGVARQLDALGVVAKSSMSESEVGTTSLITLLTGSPVLVCGPEHFSEKYRHLTCAGAPIIHPVSRRTVGSLDLTCRVDDTSTTLLPWVNELVQEIESALRDSACRREKLLLDAYLAHNRDLRHPLVTLDQDTIISNAAAARLLGPIDQAMLWEHACRAIRDRCHEPQEVALTEGAQILIETHPVLDGTETIGAVVQLRQVTTTTVSPDQRGEHIGGTFRLPGLVGSSPKYLKLCAQAARLGADQRVLVVGEPGSGRLAVARSLVDRGPVRVLDARCIESIGERQWLRDVAAESDGIEETLILRHIDLLKPAQAAATDAALTGRPSGRRIFATSEFGPLAFDHRHPLVDTFTSVLDVPPLRERHQDLPVLLNTLTMRAVGDGPPIRWMPDAVQSLTRLEWPGNITALDALVRRLAADRRGGGCIGVHNLPAEVAAQTARRSLGTLERAEATAILAALRDADGNKHRASQALGIARSTLYRKVRALGLDLSTSAF